MQDDINYAAFAIFSIILFIAVNLHITQGYGEAEKAVSYVIIAIFSTLSIIFAFRVFGKEQKNIDPHPEHTMD